MLICEKCKVEMPDDTYFCEICGEVMYNQNNDTGSQAAPGNDIDSTEKNENRFCFSCGEKLEIESKFCSSCGKQQSPAGQASVISTRTTAPEGFEPTPLAGISRKVLGEFDVAMYAHGASFWAIMQLENWGELTVYSDRIEFNELGEVGKSIVIQIDEIVSVNMDTRSYTLGRQKVVRIVLRSGKDYVLVPYLTLKLNEEAERLFRMIQSQIH